MPRMRQRRHRMAHETLGQRIKRFRLALTLSQPELAAIVRVDHATLSRWETDKRSPRSPAVQRALADALGVSVGELMGTAVNVVPRPISDRRRPVLAPLRGAVSRLQALGDEALADFVAAAVALADQRWRAKRG